MTNATWWILGLFFAGVLALIVVAVYRGRAKPEPTPTKRKNPKSRMERKLSREVYAKAIRHGATEAEARKCVALYLKRRAAKL
uniref:Uncharacterized protein n=1 Tax=Pseudomonas phage HRDY3 TaxID=3236930 RepID=A0AB39CE27_9VIRU